MTDTDTSAGACTRNMLHVFLEALDGAQRVVVETPNSLGKTDAHYLFAPEVLKAIIAERDALRAEVAEARELSNHNGLTLGVEWKAFIWTGNEGQVHDPVWIVEFLKSNKAHIYNDSVNGLFMKGLPGIALPGDVIVYQGVSSGMDHGIRFYNPVDFQVKFGEASYAALCALKTTPNTNTDGETNDQD